MSLISVTSASEHRLTDLVVYGVELFHHVGDGPPLVSVEVLADPGPEVGGLADVYRGVVPVLEDVDPRASWQVLGQPDLGVVSRASSCRKLEQVVEIGDSQRSDTLQKPVQDMGRCLGVIQRPMYRLHRAPKVVGQGSKTKVANLGSDQSPSERGGIHRLVLQAPVPKPDGHRIEKREIKSHVVSHDDRVSDELEKWRQHRFDPRCVEDHCVGDPREDRDRRWDGKPGVHQSLE